MKWFLVVLALQGCSNLPVAIKNPPELDINYKDAIARLTKYQGMQVRWGGTIIDVENEETFTRIQILYYPLNGNGRPKLSQQTEGRFVLESPKFLDPAIYRKDSEITVAGRLKGEIIRKVGKKTLKLPVISAETLHLWPERYKDECRGYYYSPYYYGIYPYGFYGYYRYPHLYYPCY
ncbi:MAG: Slp family lipoprotein [Gammaproteobacteria bacterium]